MIIAIDFDGTIVEDDHPYNDLETPLRFKPNAKQALLELKVAGHVLLLYSARTNRAKTGHVPEVDPLFRAGVGRGAVSERGRELAVARVRQMVEFVERELPGVFDAIDDGRQGKPSADLFIDDKAVTFGPFGLDWSGISDRYGDTYGTSEPSKAEEDHPPDKAVRR